MNDLSKSPLSLGCDSFSDVFILIDRPGNYGIVIKELPSSHVIVPGIPRRGNSTVIRRSSSHVTVYTVFPGLGTASSLSNTESASPRHCDRLGTNRYQRPGEPRHALDSLLNCVILIKLWSSHVMLTRFPCLGTTLRWFIKIRLEYRTIHLIMHQNHTSYT